MYLKAFNKTTNRYRKHTQKSEISQIFFLLSFFAVFVTPSIVRAQDISVPAEAVSSELRLIIADIKVENEQLGYSVARLSQYNNEILDLAKKYPDKKNNSDYANRVRGEVRKALQEIKELNPHLGYQGRQAIDTFKTIASRPDILGQQSNSSFPQQEVKAEKNDWDWGKGIYTFSKDILPLYLAPVFIASLFFPWVQKQIIKFVKQFSVFEFPGVKLSLNEETSPQIKDKAKKAYEELYEQAKEEYDKQVRMQKIVSKHSKTTDRVISYLRTFRKFPPDIRSTIHIKDIVIDLFYYQLLDYYPAQAKESKGRSKSIRYGIVGKAWRSGDRIGDGEVTTDRIKLVEQWGMTKDEAEKASAGRKSFVSVPLINRAGEVVGIYYMDAKATDAFWNNHLERDRLLNYISEICEETELLKSLIELDNQLSKIAPSIGVSS